MSWMKYLGGPQQQPPAPARRSSLCPAEPAALTDSLALFIERDLQLTEEQKPAWQRLTGDVKAAIATIDDGARKPSLVPSGDALDQLEDLRRLFTRGLDTLDQVEPAFRDFYALLDHRQQARLDAALQHGGHP
ncbi:hypothetical protein HBA54_13475 [Pelagibius litoralis]|uniref:LTXXQ motif family protein n=1 Tax=Pelagibius litoralis TaxID=374515 RepID=A0A967EY79_9PROT|nr:Spy/CpxP family protein refolding chaperone [Pelagibius litoralis]NIA69606.1 hypothetical protein [Pelagibius litoralis]